MEAANEESGPLGLPTATLSMLGLTSPLGTARSGASLIHEHLRPRASHSRAVTVSE
jgi:hypothetical protein